MATPPNGGGPQLTWSVVISGILAFCALSAGFLTIIQNQLNASDKRIDGHDKAIELIRKEYLSLREHAAFQHEQETVNNTVIARLNVLEQAQRDLIAHAAHTPAEAKEVDILSASIDKRFEATQQQINDINRQIAASILLPGGYGHPPLVQPPQR